MNRSGDIGTAIKKGLQFLRSQQRPDGGFVSYSSPDLQFQNVRPYQTTFVSALMLTALHQVPEAADVCERLANFLLSQRSPQWSFNYWARQATEHRSMPYPDDLDDTFCALIALHSYSPDVIDAGVLAAVVKLLVAVEEKPGGPYRTWLVTRSSPSVWLDVDVAVNANTARFLLRIGSPLPGLEQYLMQALMTERLESPYYPTIFPTLYYMTQAFSGLRYKQFVGRILKKHQSEGYWQTPLHTALASSIVLQLDPDADIDTARDFLLGRQNTDGSWPAEAFCIDPERAGQKHFHGAAVLTTALVVEALQRLRSRMSKTRPPEATADDSAGRALHEVIVGRAGQQFAEFDSIFQEQAHHTLDRLLKGTNAREIVLMPYLFSQSLPSPVQLRDEVFIQLGLANLYGWLAYTIYDDFLDDEGRAEQLSVANVALRLSLESFRKAVPSHGFQRKVQSVFDTIDAANAWEVTSCRYRVAEGVISITKVPDYEDHMRLAERSLGHMLTPLAIAEAAGDVSVEALQTAFKHYLIAKQICDDMHDWQDDLRAGHVSLVVATMLQQLRLPPGPYHVSSLLPQLEKQFWNISLPRLCEVVLGHTAQARQSLPEQLKADSILNQLLNKIDASMHHTSTQQRQAKHFLEAYHA